MRQFLFALVFLTFSFFSQSQTKIKPEKYPSLLWEIKGKGQKKPSYLFGTMHVSSKLAFNLSDSFYIGMRNSEVVALETNPGTWQEDFSRYDLNGENVQNAGRRYGYGQKTYSMPQDYLSINSLQLTSYDKVVEAALYSSPSVINNFLYRNGSERSSDFEEDTYLDLHIFQAGTKLGKKICGVEDFDGSMQLVKEAYIDAAKEKKKKERSYDFDEGLSYRNLEEAYRTGNLDLLDTINKVNSRSAAFDEKFLYKRNEIQAASIDSILKKGQTLFVGVGAAHLPGDRGVIEILRRMGYTLRPIQIKERDRYHKDAIEKIRVPVQFFRQMSADGFFSVSIPGKLYSFGPSYSGADMQQYADMVNGSYYMVSRIMTNAAVVGHSDAQVERKVDSLLYENIPGKILSKKAIIKNGYKGFEITNRTRRGDYQRYNIFITPFEILIFKMSGNGDYVKLGTEANQFFNSIQLKEYKSEWKKYMPSYGGFEVEMPHEPLLFNKDKFLYAAYDAASKSAFQIIRTDIHNYSFLEEDSFDLNLMEESFGASDFIQRKLTQKSSSVGGYPALDVKYKFKDSSIAFVRFLIQGPKYYTLVAKAGTENKSLQQFIQSFKIKPLVYNASKKETDTSFYFTVETPVPLVKQQKLSMYPDEAFVGAYGGDDEDESLLDNGKYLDKIIADDSTGEKIYVSFYKSSQYYYKTDENRKQDSLDLEKDWTVRRRQVDTLADNTVVCEHELGRKNSSRMLKSKSIEKDGFGFLIQVQLDTLSAPSAFVNSFFRTFNPADTLKGVDVNKKKSDQFFAQFFHADSMQHKAAVQNIHNVYMDSTDLPLLKKAIKSIGWKEKNYLDVKKDFIRKLSSMPISQAADFLKELYFAAGDTVELQYTSLGTLLQQQTAYSYKVFAEIVESDPPVLNMASSGSGNYGRADQVTVSTYSNYYNGGIYGSFMSNLEDTLELTAGIYRNILPLINLDDYEQSLMYLTAALLDSNKIAASDYEVYLPKFVIEARQLLKKQLIQEKTKAIEKARKDKDETEMFNAYGNRNEDHGNSRLSLYAKLLLPFWDKHAQVPGIINQMLASNDKRLKYNTAIMLLGKGKPVSDTIWSYFANLDEYRYDLYTDLKKHGRLNLYPAPQNNHIAIGRSQLLTLQSYNRPDTVAFVECVAVDHQGKNGFIYVFKYKENKADNTWKFATVGLLPKDDSKYEFDDKIDEDDSQAYDFTNLTVTRLTNETTEQEQVQKLIKKLVYSKRKSAAYFYQENDRYGDYSFDFRD